MTQEQREKAKTLNQERVELHIIAQSEAEKEDSRNKTKERNKEKHESFVAGFSLLCSFISFTEPQSVQ